MTAIIGIDPGASGAIAILHDARLITAFDMPQIDGRISPAGVARIAESVLAAGPEAWVEDVHAMPKQGVSSSFKFGMAHGTILGVLGALEIPVHLVSPAKWKKHHGLNKDKGASRRRATELWPLHTATFARVKDDGRAEAALIGLYGHQITNNNS